MTTLETYDTLLSRRLGTTSENYHDSDSRTSAINLAIQEFTDEYKPEELRDKEFLNFRRYGASLDTMEYANDAALQAVWTGAGDVATRTTVTDRKVGAYASNFAWTFAGGTATVTGAITSVDLSSYVGVYEGAATRGSVGFWLKAADYTKVTSITLRIGNDSSNYYSIALSSLTDNLWNYQKVAIGDGAMTGTVNWRSIDYLALVIVETASSSITVDDVRFIPPSSDYMVADMPGDVSTPLRIQHLQDLLSDSKFTFIEPDEFYRRGGSRQFTYDYSVVDSAMKLFIKDLTIERLLSHHIKDPATLADPSDPSGLTSKANEVVALLAFRRLLIDEGKWNEAELLNSRELRDAISSWQGIYGRTGKRIKSKYEKISYYNR